MHKVSLTLRKRGGAFWAKLQIRTMKPYAEIKTATKQLVDSLLEMNTDNRNLKRRTVDLYAADIMAGNWKLTNQGIGITTDNVLADGQHRLEAIKQCGYPPVALLIVHGLSPYVQIAVDSHAKRSARDMLQFAFGFRVNRMAPAIGNVLLKNSKNQWCGGFSNQILMDCISEHAEEIELVTSAPKNGNYFAAPFMAAFVIQLKATPLQKNQILKFIEAVERGEMLDKTMPEYHLRNYIAVSTKQKGGAEVQRERFAKAVKAIGASMKGEKMGVLRA